MFTTVKLCCFCEFSGKCANCCSFKFNVGYYSSCAQPVSFEISKVVQHLFSGQRWPLKLYGCCCYEPEGGRVWVTTCLISKIHPSTICKPGDFPLFTFITFLKKTKSQKIKRRVSAFTCFCSCLGFPICRVFCAFLLIPGLVFSGGGTFCFPRSRILQKMTADGHQFAHPGKAHQEAREPRLH